MWKLIEDKTLWENGCLGIKDMDEIDELIKRYGLEEDIEHVIIPFVDKNGLKKRCYLLKRKFIRINYTEDHYEDYPLEDAIKATIKYPDLLLSEALFMMYKETHSESTE